MSRITNSKSLSLWEQVCKDQEDEEKARSLGCPIGDEGECTEKKYVRSFDPTMHHPVFHGTAYCPVKFN